MPRALPILTVLLAALLAAGCGNKGQLVLPDQQPKKHKNAAPAQKPASQPPSDAGQPQSNPTDGGH